MRQETVLDLLKQHFAKRNLDWMVSFLYLININNTSYRQIIFVIMFKIDC